MVSQNLLSIISLQIDLSEDRMKLRTTINDLNPNQNYTIQIFANPEIIGTSFNFTTFPARILFSFSFLFFFQEIIKIQIQ